MKKESIRGIYSVNGVTTIILGAAIGLFLVSACDTETQITKELWIDQPVSEWPDFALTNEISFEDTTFTDLINSFLVDTGKDTIGVSTKHLFMAFEGRFGINSVDLGDHFQYWNMYPENHPDKVITTNRMINSDPNEQIGQFNTLKTRDWVIFELEDIPKDIYPLKIRFRPIEKNEKVYAVGWGVSQEDNDYPAVTEHTCFQPMGNYFYIQGQNENVTPEGRSGSPVIDENGYLVGIVSGAEGKLGVFGAVSYLKELFDRYGIEYQTAYSQQ